MENLSLTMDTGIYKILGQIKKALITSLMLGGIFIVLIGVYAIFVSLLMAVGVSAEGAGYVVGMMPFINGAFHADFGHLFGNLLILFIFLLPEVNQGYDLKKLFWTSAILSTIYIPLFILGLSWPVIGSSGVFYFLMGRFIFSRKLVVSKIFAYGFFFLIMMGDLGMMASDDGVAHLFHVMCAVIGIVTVTRLSKRIPEGIHKLIA
jgi:membrane associated rhomboid family serine protease